MNMNKQTIITILLAIVAMAGQAQVRTGQDVCLRNEATGDWLIGLFKNMPYITAKSGNMPRQTHSKANTCFDVEKMH